MWNAIQRYQTAHFLHILGVFISILKDSFPALRSVKVVSFPHVWNRYREPPWLHIIATGRPIPGTLKTIVLDGNHRRGSCNCCENAVGTSEEVVGSAQRLPELLPELAELVLRLEWCERPERHAAYIWNVLPGLRNVLRFEYRVHDREDWKPYTVIPQDVPRILDQDTNSDSEDILPTP